MDPPLRIPGVLAVGDCGWTLTVIDCTTELTEAGAVRTKAEVYVVAALGILSPPVCGEGHLSPYGQGERVHVQTSHPLLWCPGHHLHPRALLSLASFCPRCEVFFKARGVVRSRPYHKNDNAHVEEKNNSVIRKFVGHDRHGAQTEVGLLNWLYQALHLLVNWSLPSQKLLHKVRTGSHITKGYDRAQTPCAWVLTRKDVAEETKERSRSTCAALDLASLHHEIVLCQKQLDAIARKRQPLVIKKRGSDAYIFVRWGSTRMMTRTEVLLRGVWVRGMGRSEVL